MTLDEVDALTDQRLYIEINTDYEVVLVIADEGYAVLTPAMARVLAARLLDAADQLVPDDDDGGEQCCA